MISKVYCDCTGLYLDPSACKGCAPGGGDPVTENRWGDTCPLLNIARHFGVDYAVTLVLGDKLIHGRRSPHYRSIRASLTKDEFRPVARAVGEAARRFHQMYRGQP